MLCLSFCPHCYPSSHLLRWLAKLPSICWIDTWWISVFVVIVFFFFFSFLKSSTPLYRITWYQCTVLLPPRQGYSQGGKPRGWKPQQQAWLRKAQAPLSWSSPKARRVQAHLLMKPSSSPLPAGLCRSGHSRGSPSLLKPSLLFLYYFTFFYFLFFSFLF